MGCRVENFQGTKVTKEYQVGDLFVDADGDVYMVVLDPNNEIVLVSLTESAVWDGPAAEAIRDLDRYGIRPLQRYERVVLFVGSEEEQEEGEDA